MPKSERLAKFRNDSVDEVDTTDLENWVLKGREQMYEKKPFDDDSDEEDESLESLLGELSSEDDDIGKILVDSVEAAEHAEDMILRHRLDLAKLYLGKDGGYSLRKFKRIFKREMAEHPDKYMILKKGQSMDDLRVENRD
jgi:hypothetical protein